MPNLTSKDLYYKKDDFELLLDSKAQGVNIVPEFDTPGHSLAFVWARPDLGRDGNPNTSYLDVTNPETVEFIKSVWAEYMQEDDPVFLEDTVVNIGTDEYKGSNQEGKEAFGNIRTTCCASSATKCTIHRASGFSDGEQRRDADHGGERTDVQWYVGYADAQEMYDKGYQMININDGDVISYLARATIGITFPRAISSIRTTRPRSMEANWLFRQATRR